MVKLEAPGDADSDVEFRGSPFDSAVLRTYEDFGPRGTRLPRAIVFEFEGEVFRYLKIEEQDEEGRITFWGYKFEGMK